MRHGAPACELETILDDVDSALINRQPNGCSKHNSIPATGSIKTLNREGSNNKQRPETQQSLYLIERRHSCGLVWIDNNDARRMNRSAYAENTTVAPNVEAHQQVGHEGNYLSLVLSQGRSPAGTREQTCRGRWTRHCRMIQGSRDITVRSGIEAQRLDIDSWACHVLHLRLLVRALSKPELPHSREIDDCIFCRRPRVAALETCRYLDALCCLTVSRHC